MGWGGVGDKGMEQGKGETSVAVVVVEWVLGSYLCCLEFLLFFFLNGDNTIQTTAAFVGAHTSTRLNSLRLVFN